MQNPFTPNLTPNSKMSRTAQPPHNKVSHLQHFQLVPLETILDSRTSAFQPCLYLETISVVPLDSTLSGNLPEVLCTCWYLKYLDSDRRLVH